ncbi:unnamed protein product [Rotaria socialis]
MAQACLTQYFTPKRSRRSSTILANGEPLKSQKRKLKFDDENDENVCTFSTNSNKKRRISPSQPTAGYLQGCDLDQIDKLPLSRKNKNDVGEDQIKVKTFERQKQHLIKLADMNEIRKHLKVVRSHIEEVKQCQQTATQPRESEDKIQKKLVPAHERFAHLLVEKPIVNESGSTPNKKIASPADIRRCVQITESERLKKVLSKVDQSILESLPATPSKRIVGINERLLEQIRLKEESRAQLISLENTGIVKKEEQRSKTYDMFNHMRESMDIIDQLFTTERQVALECDRVNQKLSELHSARYNQDQALKMIDFILKSMEECAPGYFLKLKLRNKQYLKINRVKMTKAILTDYLEKKLIEFGLTIGPNKVSEVVTDHPFRLTMAALEIDDASSEGRDTASSGITRVTLKSSTADKGPPTDLILCNLHYPSCLQQPLDIEFYDGQTLTFGVKGPHKIHLTGYVLQPEPQEICHESHLPVGTSQDFFEAEADSTSDDEDDEDDDDDDDDDDDSDDSDNPEDFHLTHRHRLNDDEDQDLQGDYEDGYLEGEDDISSGTSSSSDSDSDDEEKVAAATKKGKKRPHAEANGHSKKKEPESKKLKKSKKNKEEPTPSTTTANKESKKGKKTEATATTSSNDKQASSTNVDEKKSNSLEINDIRVGNGPEAKFGKNVAVFYTGRLKSNNKVFDSCTKGKPFRFRLGAGEVIRGWDQGVKGMHVGGKRRLTIPPSLAYGSQKLPDIPANSTLVFDIELKNVL